MELGAAIKLAISQGLDLVEIAAAAVPPVCRVVDFGKFKYETAKKERDSKKHQNASTVKEVQLTPRIDPHDLGIKLAHAIDFLCEDMKVKVALRFRGREMAHTEIGKGVVEKFLKDLASWGHPDFPPKLIGKAINVMVSPLPKQKRAKHPNEGTQSFKAKVLDESDDGSSVPSAAGDGAPTRVATDAADTNPGGFGNAAFDGLELPPAQ